MLLAPKFRMNAEHTGKYFAYDYVTQIFKAYILDLGAKVPLTFSEKSQKLSMRVGVLND